MDDSIKNSLDEPLEVDTRSLRPPVSLPWTETFPRVPFCTDLTGHRQLISHEDGYYLSSTYKGYPVRPVTFSTRYSVELLMGRVYLTAGPRSVGRRLTVYYNFDNSLLSNLRRSNLLESTPKVVPHKVLSFSKGWDRVSLLIVTDPFRPRKKD